MGNRERRANESFKKYRANLKQEARDLKQRLKGRILYFSANRIPAKAWDRIAQDGSVQRFYEPWKANG